MQMAVARTSNRHFDLQDIVFTHRIETRASFLRIQIPMTDYEHFRKLPLQVLNQLFQRMDLCFGAGISRLPFCIQSALVTNADAVAVVMDAMRSVPLQRTTIVNRTVFGDVEVITDVGIAPMVDVVPTASLEGVVLRDAGGGAMNDDKCDGSHGLCLSLVSPQIPQMNTDYFIIFLWESMWSVVNKN